MKISRILYGILVGVSVWAYFQPWSVLGGQTVIGFATILPFSFLYFIGLILGIVILFTGYRATGLSIFAGILMIGGTLITGMLMGLLSLGGNVTLETGFMTALICSFAYPILGGILGHQFDKTSHQRISSEGIGSKIFWGVIVAIIVGIVVNLIS
jgi:hypothetical protein